MSDDAKTTPARGHRHRHGRRLVLDIDPESFAEIAAYASKMKVSVSAAVRELVEFGLEEVENAR